MKCVGCDATIENPAAYAILNTKDLPKGRTHDVKGPGLFGGSAVCKDCFVDPKHRKNPLKAHFSLPGEVKKMVGAAGSSGQIG